MNDEPKFENYKQRQNYYKEKYKNRGVVFLRSEKRYNKDGTVATPGKTYRKYESLFDGKSARKLLEK